MRKVGGILCEASTLTSHRAVAVVGFGLNLGPMGFPDGLKEIAVSISEVKSGIVPKESLAAKWIDGLERRIGKLSTDSSALLIEEWRQRGEPFGRSVSVGNVAGVTVDLNESGRLLVRQDSGEIVDIPGGIVENRSG